MAGNENRRRNNELREVKKDLLETQQALAYTINIVDQLSKAHNTLQGRLIATGVIEAQAA